MCFKASTAPGSSIPSVRSLVPLLRFQVHIWALCAVAFASLVLLALPSATTCSSLVLCALRDIATAALQEQCREHAGHHDSLDHLRDSKLTSGPLTCFHARPLHLSYHFFRSLVHFHNFKLTSGPYVLSRKAPPSPMPLLPVFGPLPQFQVHIWALRAFTQGPSIFHTASSGLWSTSTISN